MCVRLVTTCVSSSPATYSPLPPSTLPTLAYILCGLRSLHMLIAGEDIRERTDALDAAGNTTAAIGKGFAIGSAALVSLALFGAYVTRSKIDLIESSILDPKVGFSAAVYLGCGCVRSQRVCGRCLVGLLASVYWSASATQSVASAGTSYTACNHLLHAADLCPGQLGLVLGPHVGVMLLSLIRCADKLFLCVCCRCLLVCWLVPCFPSGSVP